MTEGISKTNRYPDLDGFLGLAARRPFSLILRALRSRGTRIEQPVISAPEYGYLGDYSTYEEAARECTGYDTSIIAETVARQRTASIAALKKHTDERVVEVLAAFSVAISHLGKSNISVLDYGGGNGYYCDLLSYFLPHVSFAWTVVETPSMIKACADVRHINWQTSFPAGAHFDIALMSGILQVLPKPYEVLETCQANSSWIVIQKIPLTKANRITRQVVPPHIHPGSYPHIFFNETDMRSAIEKNGRIKMEWTVEKEHGSHAPIDATSRGFLIRLEQIQ